MFDRIAQWLKAAEDWLDARGRPAWIVAMVLGFILFWPIGLAILLYMLWSHRMTCNHSHWRRRYRGLAPSGNTAFDEYKMETLRRLEEEQSAFQSFLDRLRRAKDKAEFDQFMDERRRNGGQPGDEAVA
ncbi:MAG TPA: DUF2852 domain-containing protein [Paracoccaceae bacterium]|nr:DUF2852 domain-containing protein [Paracoccaceae bacterium]